MITYQDYLDTFAHRAGHASSEAGSSDPLATALSEEDWNNLSTADKYKNTDMGDRFRITEDDQRYKDLKDKTGASGGRDVMNIVYGSEVPTEINGVRPFIDYDRIVKGDGWYAYADSNETPEFKASKDHQLGRRFLVAAVMMVGGLAASGALAGGAAAAGEGALAASAGQGFGTAGYAGAAGEIYGAAGAAGASSAAGAATPEYTPFEANYPGNQPITTGPNPTFTPEGGGPGWAAEGGAPVANAPAPAIDPALPPGTQAPAPVSAQGTVPNIATQAPAPVTDISVQPGIIDTARNAGANAMGWYNGLSPGARMVVTSAVSQGAQALIGASSQRAAARSAEEQEEQTRRDRVRRQSLPSFGSAFTPKPGIIDSRRGG
jgi:hypothetical protein